MCLKNPERQNVIIKFYVAVINDCSKISNISIVLSISSKFNGKPPPDTCLFSIMSLIFFHELIANRSVSSIRDLSKEYITFFKPLLLEC
jgi:hypothetical protein